MSVLWKVSYKKDLTTHMEREHKHIVLEKPTISANTSKNDSNPCVSAF